MPTTKTVIFNETVHSHIDHTLNKQLLAETYIWRVCAAFSRGFLWRHLINTTGYMDHNLSGVSRQQATWTTIHRVCLDNKDAPV